MGRRSTSLNNYTNTAISREIASDYDNVEIVANNIADVNAVADLLTAEVLQNLEDLITLTEDVQQLQIDMDAAEVVIAGKAPTVHTHTSEQVVDSADKRFVTDADKAKWNALDTNEELRDRTTHTGVQSLDTTVDSVTRIAMTPAERTKLGTVATGATANDTDIALRDRTTHTGQQSIDTITETATKKIMTDTERSKLAGIEVEANKYIHPTKHSVSVLDGLGHELEYVRVDESGVATFDSIRWGDLAGKPSTYTPSPHVHSMDDVTSGTISATRIDTTSSRRFVTDSQIATLANVETRDSKGVPNGYAPLDSNGKINPSYLGSLNLLDVFTPSNIVSMLLLSSANPGDVAYVQDIQKTYMLVALPVDTLSNWKEINATASVISINGLTGTVAIDTDNIPEGDNLYYTNERVDDRVKDLLVAGTNVTLTYDDAANTLTVSANDTSVNWSEIQSKPTTVAGYAISDVYTNTEVDDIFDSHRVRTDNPHSVTKTQVGLGNVDNESKATMFTSPAFTGTVTGVTKGMVGLGNVDNTSDIDKPVSTAQATAIGLKLDTAIANASHIGRADKYLAAQAVANMIYTNGKLTKVRYNNDTDVEYEVLTYGVVTGKLDNVAHYVAGTLAGNTALSYTNGKLVSAIYTGV